MKRIQKLLFTLLIIKLIIPFNSVLADNTQQNVPAGNYSGTGISTNLDGNPSTGKWDTHPDGTYDEYINNASTPDNVKQSQSTTSATDFAAGLPISTIFIDTSKIGHFENPGVRGEFTLLTDKENIRGGFTHIYTPDTGDLVSYNPFNTVDIDGNPVTGSLMQIEPNKINELNGDLFQFIYRDAAILPNGTKAHLKIVYSNARIAIDQRLGVTKADLTTEDFQALGIDPNNFELEASNYQGSIHLAKGASVERGGSDNRYLGTRTNNKGVLQIANNTIDGGYTVDQLKAMSYVLDKTIKNNWPATNQSFAWENANTATTASVGESIDITYQIVDDAGNPVNGTFIFAVTGINLDRDPYAGIGINAAKPIWVYTSGDTSHGIEANQYLHFFTEAMSINSGVVSDYIYVRPNTQVFETEALQQAAGTGFKHNYYYSHVIKDEHGNPKFIGNNYQASSSSPAYGGNDRSYNSGFVTLANAADGITLTATGHGSGTGGMATQAYGGKQIWYRYTSTTGQNGKIETTSEGNYGGTLDDKSDTGVKSSVLDQGIYIVPEGKTVTYTMTPDSHYRIKKLEIKDSDGNIKEIKYNDDELYKMSYGDTVSVTDAAGNTATLTAMANGVFTLEIPYAKNDEEVNVEWEKYIGDLTIKKETIDNISGSFDFEIKVWKTDDTTVQLDLSTKFGDPNSQGYYEFTLQNDKNIVIQIPYGYSYEVFEKTQEKWKLKSINGDLLKTKAEGSISELADDVIITFLNELITYDLTLKKLVKGDMADVNKEFEFQITIYDGDNLVDENFIIEKNNNIIEIKNGDIIKLKHGETAIIKNLTTDYRYIIAEADTEYDESYRIIDSDNNIMKDTTAGLNAEGIMNKTQTVEFTNVKNSQILSDIPKTGDNIMINVFMLLISLSGLCGGILYINKNK